MVIDYITLATGSLGVSQSSSDNLLLPLIQENGELNDQWNFITVCNGTSTVNNNKVVLEVSNQADYAGLYRVNNPLPTVAGTEYTLRIKYHFGDAFISNQPQNVGKLRFDKPYIHNPYSMEEINTLDIDLRPRLGLYYWDELQNPSYTSWQILVANEDNTFTQEQWISGSAGYIGSGDNVIRDFSPDVDVRMRYSMGNNVDVPIVKYYDNKISPEEHENSSGPGEVQFYFYPRQSGHPFSPRDITPDLLDEFYIAFIDWGDGSPIEFKTNPHSLGSHVKHHYNSWGFYTITGYMIHRIEGDDVDINFIKFSLNIFLNKRRGFSEEFSQLGGDGYILIPYEYTTPIIGGISDRSLYFKTTKILSGFLSESDQHMTPLNIAEQFKIEQAVATADENFKGKSLLAFTGSYINSNSTIYNDTTNTVYDPNELKGFFSGSNWQWEDGSIINPVLIHNGYGTTMGELGQYVGNIDLGQVRVFLEGSVSMREFLGFENPIHETPGNIQHWKNIIPENYTLSDREGVEIVEDNILMVDVNNSQEWSGSYYYPVLPKLDKFGRFDESLGFQNNNIPFGSSNREWNKTDEIAFITKPNINHPKLILDLDFSEISDGKLNDIGGVNNVGVPLTDFKLKLDSNRRVIKGEGLYSFKIAKNQNKKAY